MPFFKVVTRGDQDSSVFQSAGAAARAWAEMMEEQEEQNWQRYDPRMVEAETEAAAEDADISDCRGRGPDGGEWWHIPWPIDEPEEY